MIPVTFPLPRPNGDPTVYQRECLGIDWLEEIFPPSETKRDALGLLGTEASLLPVSCL